MATIASNRGATPGASAPSTASSHPYTCNSCQVAFRSSDLQRAHMRSDWHRYNLKRRVTSLPPISSEVFSEKVIQAQASSTAAASRAAYEKSCEVCSKTYFSENAYQNHIGSQKHKAKLAMGGKAESQAGDDATSVMSSTFSLGEPAVREDVKLDSDVAEEFGKVVEGLKDASIAEKSPIALRPTAPSPSSAAASTSTEDCGKGLNCCLFCNYASPTVPLNVVHMERYHGMFIPEKTFLVNLEGLLKHLFEKINHFHECLYCGKLKPTVFGLQTHMRDTAHCKIPFDTEEQQLDIGDFYDFTSTYSDVEDEDDEDERPGARSGGVKLGARREAKVEGDKEMEEGDGWETDSSASSLDSADLTAVPLDQREHMYEKLSRHPHHSSDDPRPHHNRDGWHSHAHKHAHAAFYSDYELHLPSGRAVGHRSLARYYRQNLVHHPSPAERQERQAIEEAHGSDSEEDDRVARRDDHTRGRQLTTRANGGTGMLGVSEQKKKEIKVEEKRARKVEERERRKFQWGNNKQANSQKHFRDPLLQ